MFRMWQMILNTKIFYFHKENHQTLLSDTDDILLSQGKNLVSVHSSGTPLFSTKFLDITEIVGILKSRTFVHTSIPDGLKNNVYFILDEKKNMEQKSYGKPPEFYDDCGAWDRKGKGAPTTYYHVKGEIISQITFNKSRNLYYTCKGLRSGLWLGQSNICFSIFRCIQVLATRDVCLGSLSWMRNQLFSWNALAWSSKCHLRISQRKKTIKTKKFPSILRVKIHKERFPWMRMRPRCGF